MIKKNIEVTINSKTRQVFFEDNFLGIKGENLQGYLVFKFQDEFVNGVATLKVEQEGNKYNIYEVEKEKDSYKVIIKSSLLKTPMIYMALSITENGNEDEIPVFVSNKFFMLVGDTIESTEEIPDEYDSWIDSANSKLISIENSLEMANEKSEYAKQQGDYAKEQGDYAKEQTTNVDETLNYVVQVADGSNEKAETAISIAKGANQALDYLDYQNMIINFNAFEKEKFSTGQQIMIKKLNVPDVWIYQLTNDYVSYTYVSDEDVINLLNSDTGLHVGYYVLSTLETQKVDLTNYVKNTDYATTTTGGVVKLNPSYGINRNTANNNLYINAATESEIANRSSIYKPIVPSNLEYAVGSVKASETQSGTIKAWITENEDGEIGLNISTEV